MSTNVNGSAANKPQVDAQKVKQMREMLAQENGAKKVEQRYGAAAAGSDEFKEAQRQRAAAQKAREQIRERMAADAVVEKARERQKVQRETAQREQQRQQEQREQQRAGESVGPVNSSTAKLSPREQAVQARKKQLEREREQGRESASR